ncbi:MAG: V-type ATPase subunit [Clostridia bacterium]|nr:V-type ATPase subunit [Clostridia bacterium]
MKDTRYAYAVAHVRALENRMLQRTDYNALLRASSLDEATRFLADKRYGESDDADAYRFAARRSGEGPTGQGRGEYASPEAMLDAELMRTWNAVRAACPKGAPIELLLYQNDFHNLKTVLKTVAGGLAHEGLTLEPNAVAPAEIRRAFVEGKPEILPERFREAAVEAHRILIQEEDGQRAEIVLDKAFFNIMREDAMRTKSGFLAGWVEMSIAVMDMKTALRGAYTGKSKAFLRDAMVECGRISVEALADAAARGVSTVLQVFTHSGFEEAAAAARESTGAFEKWCDNAILRYLQPARYRAFGFEPIVAFWVGKQYELQAVRMLLSRFVSGIGAEALTERLRDSYQ